MAEHRSQLDNIYDTIVNALLNATKVAFPSSKRGNNVKYKPVPGWNECVREYHKLAREYFYHGKLLASLAMVPYMMSCAKLEQFLSMPCVDAVGQKIRLGQTLMPRTYVTETTLIFGRALNVSNVLIPVILHL